MSVRKVSAFVVCVALLCSNNQAVGAQSIVREQWCASGGDSPFELLAITGAHQFADGAVWVADGRAGRILRLEPSRQSFSLAVKTGDGPGEVRAPGMMAEWRGGGVGVHDAAHGSIEVFDQAGAFVRRIPIDGQLINVKGFVSLASGGFIMSGGIAGIEQSIHVFDSTGKRVGGLHALPKTQNPRAGLMVGGGTLGTEAGSRVYFSQGAPHLIGVVDVRRARMDTLAQDTRLLQPIGDDFIVETRENGQPVRSFRWFFPQSRSIHPFGTRLVNTVWLKDEGSTIVEVYDKVSGKRAKLERLATAYKVLARARDTALLGIKEDNETGQQSLCKLALSL